MPWYYSQTTGRLNRDGNPLSGKKGYSGSGAGKDNPQMEGVPEVGPIPAGTYRIGMAYDDTKRKNGKGPVVMRLTPQNHNAHGRTNFLIHGDSIEHPGD